MDRDRDRYIDNYNNADNAIKDVMSSEKTTTVIKELREEYGIEGENAGDLAYIVGTVFLGMMHPKNFIKTLESGLNISHEDAVAIAKRINSDVFAPIKKQLIAIHNIEATKKAAGNTEEDQTGAEEQLVTEPEPPKEIHNTPLPKPPAPPAPPKPKKKGEESKENADTPKGDMPKAASDPYREPVT